MSETEDHLRGRLIAPEAFRNAFLMPFLTKRGQRAQPGSAGFKDGLAALFRETGETVEH